MDDCASETAGASAGLARLRVTHCLGFAAAGTNRAAILRDAREDRAADYWHYVTSAICDALYDSRMPCMMLLLVVGAVRSISCER